MAAFSQYLLPYADVSWHTEETPYTNEYDDIYWSTSGGLDEKRHVFLEGCRVQERFNQLQSNDSFCIAELGFGFGLNFLLTLKVWRETKSKGQLDFISFEKHLIPLKELEKAASNFGLVEEYELLAPNYPKPIPGPHQITISDDCTLTLVIGDISDHLNHLNAQLDAVYLDGFSPSKNEVMWQGHVLQHLASQMRSGSLAATYSVAGELRRTLQASGLTTEKVSGYGNKRHMLVAERPGQWQPRSFKSLKVGILGAGLTGLFCAAALSKRGHEVTLIDQNGLHGAVRDIHQIAIYPQLSQTPQPYSNLYLRAFHFSIANLPLHQCGRLELLANNEKVTKGQELARQLPTIAEFKQPAECSSLLGFPVEEPGLFVTDAGWLDPSEIHPRCKLKTEKVGAVTRAGSSWRLQFENAKNSFEEVDALIMASGPATFPILEPLNLMPLRGQSLRLQHPSVAPECILSGRKTWFPKNAAGSTTVSGTYSRFDRDTNVRVSDEAELLDAVTPYVKDPNYSSQVGIRSATRDRLPIVGRIPNWTALVEHLASATFEQFTHVEPNLYACLGFGSHGGTLGPYCAELISRMVSGDGMVESMGQIEPIRFALRDGKVPI